MNKPKLTKWTPTTDLMMLRRMGKLIEELGELSNVAARCIIQGIDEVDPGTGKVNRQRLHDELADVLAQIHCTVETLELSTTGIAERRNDKIAQMAEWEAMFVNAPVDKLTAALEELEQNWLLAHDDRCTNTEDCASFGSTTKPCHLPRPTSLPGNFQIKEVAESEAMFAPRLGDLVRYGDGSTALVLHGKPHAGGWHGTQCMGGTTFYTKIYRPSQDDRLKWVECAIRYRKVSPAEARAEAGLPPLKVNV